MTPKSLGKLRLFGGSDPIKSAGAADLRECFSFFFSLFFSMPIGSLPSRESLDFVGLNC